MADTIKAVSDSTKHGMIIVNPDGSNVGGGAEATDGSAFTADTSTGTPAMGVYEATPTTLTDGKMGLMGLDANRNVKTTLATGITREADTISTALATDVLMNENTELTPKFAVINHATSGDNTIVAAVTGKKIRVLALFARNAGAVDIRFESGTGGTALTGVMETEAADPPIVLPFNPVGWFETASGSLLNMELGGAVSVDGGLVYVEV